MDSGEPHPPDGAVARPAPEDPRHESAQGEAVRAKVKRPPAKRPAKAPGAAKAAADAAKRTDPWEPVTTKTTRRNGKNGSPARLEAAPKPAKRRSEDLAVTEPEELASTTLPPPVLVVREVEGPFEIPEIVPAEQPETAEPASGATVITVPSTTVFTDTDGTDGLPSLLAPTTPARALRAPVIVRRRRRPRVRRVTRVVRHVDTWSVFKVALVFNVFLYGVCLTAGVLLWQVAQNTGTVDNIERFFESNGWQTFELHGGEIFHNAWIIGLFLAVGGTGMAVLAATLFNLITDLVGGIRVSVLEEEVIAREDRGLFTRRPRLTPMRRRTDFPDAPVPDEAAEGGNQPAAVPVTDEPG